MYTNTLFLVLSVIKRGNPLGERKSCRPVNLARVLRDTKSFGRLSWGEEEEENEREEEEEEEDENMSWAKAFDANDGGKGVLRDLGDIHMATGFHRCEYPREGLLS